MDIRVQLDKKLNARFNNDDFAFVLPLFFKKYSYQTMWRLRHLEKDIEKETGYILVKPKPSNSSFEVTGFSLTLTILIEAALADLTFTADE